ncbi:hypothetical protein IIA79_02005 [bacterium]|nr:hypothetical protein [bacterium]
MLLVLGALTFGVAVYVPAVRDYLCTAALAAPDRLNDDVPDAGDTEQPAPPAQQVQHIPKPPLMSTAALTPAQASSIAAAASPVTGALNDGLDSDEGILIPPFPLSPPGYTTADAVMIRPGRGIEMIAPTPLGVEGVFDPAQMTGPQAPSTPGVNGAPGLMNAEATAVVHSTLLALASGAQADESEGAGAVDEESGVRSPESGAGQRRTPWRRPC